MRSAIQHSTFNIQHSSFLIMAEETPVHEVRPTTQELKIPARFIPSPTVEPGHTFASVTDHISSIVLRKKMPPSWWLLFGVEIGRASCRDTRERREVAVGRRESTTA